MKERYFFQTYLKNSLASRCERNPRYSLRSFAKSLRLDPGALSRILSGKEIPSLKNAEKIFTLLEPNDSERREFLASIVKAHQKKTPENIHPRIRKIINSSFFKISTSTSSKDLSLEQYRVIADWYHAALIELTFVYGFQASPRWIAKTLGIQEAEAMLAIERLLNLGVLEWKANKLVKTTHSLSLKDKHLTTPALKKSQKQFLERAILSLENDPIEERSFTTITMPVDPEKINSAKELIREFNQSMSALLESGNVTRVYNLSICLYPLHSKIEKKEKIK